MTSIEAAAFAEVLDALPARLRKRLDAAVERAADWPREAPDDGGELIRVDEETTVMLRVNEGVVRSAADVVCSCLLAPACLHRAAVASRLPVYEPGAALAPGQQEAPSSAPTTVAVASEPEGKPLSMRERAAVEALWEAGSAVLVAGLVGASLFTEAELARATHQVRALSLQRAAALGARVGIALRQARERRGEHRLEQYTADLRDLLFTAHSLLHATDPGVLDEARGIARRSYSEHGSLRLYGLFTEPIVARSGHAGVIGYAVDGEGTIWSTASIAPGGAELVRPSYDGALKLGGTTLAQRELGRSGLLVSGASSSPDRRLSSGKTTKAVRTAGIAWTEEPIAGLFEQPLSAQFARALRADREAETYQAGDELVFLRARVFGQDEAGALILELEDPGQPDSTAGLIRCAALGPAPIYRHNFDRLAELGLRIRLIARPDNASPGTVIGLAVYDPELPAPDVWSGRVNLGLDRIPAAEDDEVAEAFAAEGAAAQEREPSEESGSEPPSVFAPDPTSLHLVRSHVEQAASAGRAITRTTTLDRDCARLDREALHTAASLLRELAAQAQSVRDEFQRPLDSPAHPRSGYPRAWLAAAVYAQAADEELTVNRWLRALN